MSLRTGDEYLKSLKDNRQIIYNGKPVDVTQEKGFRNAAQAVAQFYDFQHLPAAREVMTYETPEGGRAGMSFKEAFSKADVQQRALAFAAWADVTCGFMGRSPDYMNASMAALASIARKLPDRGKTGGSNIRRLYQKVRDEDLCLTHCFVDPFKVAANEAPGFENRFRIVREQSDGMYFSGTRGLATLAPFSNLNFNLGLPQIPGRDGIPTSCTFLMPISAPGVSWICREGLDQETSHFNAPMASRADEFDCVAVFDNCFVPFDDVLILIRGAELSVPPAQRLIKNTQGALQHHTIIRFIAKTKFILGLAHLLAESSKISRFINIQERLGEIVTILHTMQSFAIAAVEGAERDPDTGVYSPNTTTTSVASTWTGTFYPRLIAILLELGAGRYVTTPQEATLEALGERLDKYYRGATSTGKENAALHRLAWDLAGTSYGIRQDLYERFHNGDRTQALVHAYQGIDKTEAIGMVQRILKSPAQNRRRYPDGEWRKQPVAEKPARLEPVAQMAAGRA